MRSSGFGAAEVPTVVMVMVMEMEMDMEMEMGMEMMVMEMAPTKALYLERVPHSGKVHSEAMA